MSDTLHLFLGFDGTGNHRDNDSRIGDGSTTNVARLLALHPNDANHKPLYEPGVGTRELSDDELNLVRAGQATKSEFYDSYDMATGWGDKGVMPQIDKMQNQLAEVIEDNGDKVIIIDMVGFSRGALAPRHFINTLHALYASEIASGKMVLNNVLLLDTVATVGLSNAYNPGFNLNLTADSAKNVQHYTAYNEKRRSFSLESLRDSDGNLPDNMDETVLFGVHSNIGNGYGADEHSEWYSRQSGYFSSHPLIQ